MGAELFTMDWVQSIVLFFSYLAWALYGTGLVVACFETGVEYSSGRGNIRETALNAIKGFMAVSLFTVFRYGFMSCQLRCRGTSPQRSPATGLPSGMWPGGHAGVQRRGINIRPDGRPSSGLRQHHQRDHDPVLHHPYGVCDHQGLLRQSERGGIPAHQIAVGSLYMFSPSRIYGWLYPMVQSRSSAYACRHFLQATILVAGLMVFKDHALLGLGLMLSPVRSPYRRSLGLDTSPRANLMRVLSIPHRPPSTPHARSYRRWRNEQTDDSSLFDGIGGFPLAAIRSGITPVWASEIEAFPIEVTKLRFPDMLHVGDITKLHGAELPPWTSSAGAAHARICLLPAQGQVLPGARSGLSWSRCDHAQKMRLTRKPVVGRCQYTATLGVLGENVPGAFREHQSARIFDRAGGDRADLLSQ